MDEIVKFELKPAIAKILFEIMVEKSKFYMTDIDLSDADYEIGLPFVYYPGDDAGDIYSASVFFDIKFGRISIKAFQIDFCFRNDEDDDGEIICCPRREYKIDYEHSDDAMFIENGSGYIENIYRADAARVVSEIINNYLADYGIF